MQLPISKAAPWVNNVKKIRNYLKNKHKIDDPIGFSTRTRTIKHHYFWINDVKPTTKAELALNGMVELAKIKPAKPMALSQLAEKQAISLSYLEQVFAALRRSGLVLSVRGPGGGYLLSRPAGTISAGDIISAVDMAEDSDAPSEATSEAEASNNDTGVLQFWTLMKQRTVDIYHQVSLQDVVDGSLEQHSSSEKMAAQAAE